MARQSTTIAAIALASAILAAFVPDVSDASASVIGKAGVGHLGLGMAGAGSARMAVIAGPRTANVRPAGQASRRIPVGCERLVSPLVRSAYAAQVALCVT